MGPEGGSGLGAAAWILWLRNEYGIFEKVSYGGCVLKNASAMIAEREALRKGIEHLTVLFPTVVSSFVFKVENSGRTVQYKLNAQSLRLFGLHSDVNHAHCAGAYLQNKQTNLDLLQDFLQRQLVKELGSEIAGGGKDSQQTQPKTKKKFVRTGKPVLSEQQSGSSVQEIENVSNLTAKAPMNLFSS